MGLPMRKGRTTRPPNRDSCLNYARGGMVVRPSAEQLERINRGGVQTPLAAEDVYVFSDLLVDTLPTSYYTVLHENLLMTFMQDLEEGIGLLLAHDTRRLAIGRSFEASLRKENVGGEIVTSLYGGFYVPRGMNIEEGMSTDDIIQRIDTGVQTDTSIGFRAEMWTCSICENDFFSSSCTHWPGKKYIVNRAGEDVVETMYVILGMDGKGELVENSLVYAGASPRARIQSSFGSPVIKLGDFTKLQLVDNVKTLPRDAVIYQVSCAGQRLWYSDGTGKKSQFYVKGSGEAVALSLEDVLGVMQKYQLKTGSVAELEQSLESLKKLSVLNVAGEVALQEGDYVSRKAFTELEERLAKVSEELSAAKEELQAKKEELVALQQQEYAEELTRIKEEKEQLAIEKTALEKMLEEFQEKADLADEYRKSLLTEAKELAVRVNGNALDETLFVRFLESLSVAELKDTVQSLKQQVKDRYGYARVSKPKDVTAKHKTQLRDDFESEEEFREFVAEKAQEYAKENQVPLSEATKLMYKKYANGSEA